jgi:WXG100 family type VII secretion target
MSFLPDPAELRALATRIDQHAGAARARADRLGAAVAATAWHGVAARAFQGQAHLAVAGLRRAAGRLDEASDALRRHADNVGTVVGALESAARAGLVTAGELLQHSGAVLRGIGHGVTRVIDTGGDLVGGVLDVVGL